MILNLDIPDELFLGDSVTINGEIENDDGTALNITGYKIRAELYNRFANEVRKANTISGGSDSQIDITDASAGEFTIYIDKDDTDGFDNEIFIEIEVEDTNGRVTTLYKQRFFFEDEGIDWTTP